MTAWAWVATLGIASGMARADDCEALYRLRPQKIQEAVACFQKAANAPELKEQPALRQAALERLAEALVWEAHRSPTSKQRLVAIRSGLKVSQSLLAEFPAAASGFYWNAIYSLCEARELDPGFGPPLSTLEALPEGKSKLKKALSIDPSVHGYGPNRTLGVIGSALPKFIIFSRERKEALPHLRTAYQKAPRFSANAVELARHYVKISKDGDEKAAARENARKEAYEVLKDLISSSPQDFNAARAAETAADQETARQLIAELESKK